MRGLPDALAHAASGAVIRQVLAVGNTADAVAKVAVPDVRFGHGHIRDGDPDPAGAGPRSWLRRRATRSALTQNDWPRAAGPSHGWTVDCTPVMDCAPVRRAMRHMRSATSVLLVAAIALLSSPLALAETPQVLAGYTVTSWTLVDGVPVGPVNAIAQNADGYLWLGTTRGIVRFDGARLTPWDAIYSTRLPDAEVLALSAS